MSAGVSERQFTYLIDSFPCCLQFMIIALYFSYFDVLVQFDYVLFSLTFKCFWLKCARLLGCFACVFRSGLDLVCSSAAKSLHAHIREAPLIQLGICPPHISLDLSHSQNATPLSLSLSSKPSASCYSHYKGGHSQFHSLTSRKLREEKWPDCSCCPYSSWPVKVSHSWRFIHWRAVARGTPVVSMPQGCLFVQIN